jgi:hypothetical protein
MQYQHRREFQQMLQEAIRLKRMQRMKKSGGKLYTWEELSELSGVGKGKRMTLMRFDKATFQTTGQLPLDLRLAQTLWRNLRPEIKEVQKDGNSDLYAELFDDRLVSNVISWGYRCHESQLQKLVKDEGLAERYFCYKPSFRVRGHVVKSEFHIDPVLGEPMSITGAIGGAGKTTATIEYLHVDERQESTMNGISYTEESSGTGVSKSGKLWIFLKGEREQPRIICLWRKDTSVRKRGFNEVKSVSRMYGKILESDMMFGNGVYTYRVCFVSEEADRQAHAELRGKLEEAPPYKRDMQLEIVHRSVDIEHSPVFLDPSAIRWLGDDLDNNGPDPEASP